MGALVRGRDRESGEPTISLELQVGKTKASRGEPRVWMGRAEEEEKAGTGTWRRVRRTTRGGWV